MNEKSKIVYIAGPYRNSRGEYFVRQNIRNAEEASVFILQHGGIPMCPHKNMSGLHGIVPTAQIISAGLVLLSRCDAVLMIEGWEKSIGSRKERMLAIDTDIPVFYDFFAIEKFLEGE